jgi:hypothetical protein
MPAQHTQTSGGARLAVVYITVGSIIDVWTALWLLWQKSHPSASDSSYFWCYGFFLTGLTLVIIGLALGRIGRSARQAEAPVDTTANAGMAAYSATVPAPAPPPAAPQATMAPGNAQAAVPAAPAGVVVPTTSLRR